MVSRKVGIYGTAGQVSCAHGRTVSNRATTHLLMRRLVGDELVEDAVVLLSLNPTRAVCRSVEMRVVEHDDLRVLGDVYICKRRESQRKTRRARLSWESGGRARASFASHRTTLLTRRWPRHSTPQQRAVAQPSRAARGRAPRALPSPFVAQDYRRGRTGHAHRIRCPRRRRGWRLRSWPRCSRGRRRRPAQRETTPAPN